MRSPSTALPEEYRHAPPPPPLRRPRRHLGPDFALSGTAYAVAALPPNSVDTQAIQDQAVTNPKLKVNAILSSRIKDGTLTTADIADGGLTGTDIQDGSIGNADLGVDSVQAVQIADNTIDGGEIIDNSMGSADIAPGAITNSELGSNSVTGDKVANGSLGLADLVGTDVTGTVGAFALNAGQCAPISIGIGGAHLGQAVLISFTTAPPNSITWSPARVAAANAVTVVVCNVSSASVSNPGQGIRIVTFG